MLIYSFVELENTITNMQENIQPDEALFDYTEDLCKHMAIKISPISVKLHTMKYDMVDVTLYVQDFFDDNYKTKIACKFYIDTDFYGELTNDDIFDIFDMDKTFTSALIYYMNQYCLDIEKEIKDIKIPINTDISYINGCLYAKIKDDMTSIEWGTMQFNKSNITEYELCMNSYGE